MNDTLEMPARIRALPLDPIRKVPVPWFVTWLDGKPEFRVADSDKLVRAVKERLCWVCGERLDNRMTFVVGPMCAINRTSSEPPSHPDCARYSARACPFLSRPRMERREGGLGHLGATCAGEMIRRNPGVTLLWTTRGYQLFDDGKGGVLFHLGPHTAVEWFAEGRAATRAEVTESVRTGLPALEALARGQDGAMDALAQMTATLERIYPEATDAE